MLISMLYKLNVVQIILSWGWTDKDKLFNPRIIDRVTRFHITMRNSLKLVKSLLENGALFTMVYTESFHEKKNGLNLKHEIFR
jgi:hypothetical protein